VATTGLETSRLFRLQTWHHRIFLPILRAFLSYLIKIQLLDTGITRQIDSLTRLFQQNKANLPELRVSGRLTKVAFLFTMIAHLHWNVTSQNLSEHVHLWIHFLAGQYQNTYHMTLKPLHALCTIDRHTSHHSR